MVGNRVVDTAKIGKLLNDDFQSCTEEWIYKSLAEFVADIDVNVIQYTDIISLAYMDWVSKEKTPIKYLQKGQVVKYLFLRYFFSYEISVRIYDFLRRLK